MNTLQYYLIDTIIQSPEYHINPKITSGKLVNIDFLGQIEAEEEFERKCRRHSSRTLVQRPCLVTAHNQNHEDSDIDENTPILPCTCGLDPEQATTMMTTPIPNYSTSSSSSSDTITF